MGTSAGALWICGLLLLQLEGMVATPAIAQPKYGPPTSLDLVAPKNYTWYGYSMALSDFTLAVGAPYEGRERGELDQGAVYVYEWTPSDGWVQWRRLTQEPSPEAFGWAVAVSGDTLVVGSPWENSDAIGVGGNGDPNGSVRSGAAHVYERQGGHWVYQAYLKPSNTGNSDRFGYTVAISGDTVVIGAPFEDSNAIGINGNGDNNAAVDAGAAYVFVRQGETWSQQAYLKASNPGPGDRFGNSVAISENTILVGATGEDSASTGVDGIQSNNSALGSGAAYVFVRQGTSWSQQAYLKPSNTTSGYEFGKTVTLSGQTAVIGSPGEGSNATGVNGDHTNRDAAGAGAAYVFVRAGTVWAQQAYLKASNTDAGDGFGASTAVEGDRIVVGARSERSNATGVDGNQSDNSLSGAAGAAYAFDRTGVDWQQVAYLKGSNTMSQAQFGTAVAVSADHAIVGAPYESRPGYPQSGDAHAFARRETNDPIVSVIGFSQTEFSVVEGTGRSCQEGMRCAVLTVWREGPATNAVSVGYWTISLPNDTASSGLDYVHTLGQLEFSPDELEAEILVPIHRDELLESNETFTVELFNPSIGAVLSQDKSTATVTIRDGRANLDVFMSLEDGAHSRRTGDTVVYRVQVSNWGPAAVEDAEVEADVPLPLLYLPGLPVIRSQGSVTWDFANRKFVWATGPLASGGTASMTFAVFIPETVATPVRVESEARGSVLEGAADGYPDDDTSRAHLIIGGSDLAVNIIFPFCGSMNDKIVLRNNGPEDSGAFNVVLEADERFTTFVPESTPMLSWTKVAGTSSNQWMAAVAQGQMAAGEVLKPSITATLNTNFTTGGISVTLIPLDLGTFRDLNPDNDRAEARFYDKCHVGVGVSGGRDSDCSFVTAILVCIFINPDGQICDELAGRPNSLVHAVNETGSFASLAPFYAMRSVLAQTEEGRRLRQLYELHTAELSAVFLSELGNPGFVDDGIAILGDFQTGFAHYLAGAGEAEFITPEMIDRVNRLADRFVELSSPELVAAIELERARFNHLEDFIGVSFAEWGRLLGALVPESPFIILSSAQWQENGDLYFEANHAPNHTYSVWRTPKLSLVNWEPVTEAQIEIQGNTVRIRVTNPADPDAYYQVRATPTALAR